MKRLLFTIMAIVLTFSLMASTSPQTTASPELSVIDSLMWQRPDSALTCLLPSFDTCCRDGVHTVSTAYNCHYAHLLLAELLYKNDNPQINRPELLQAVQYFDSLLLADTRSADTRGVSLRRDASHASALTPPQTIAFLDARAHYINGVGYYENDSIVEACAEYLKALEIMEEHFGEKELVGKRAKFMTYTYNRLGDMFEEQLLAEPAIACYKQALHFSKREPTSIYGIPILMYSLGVQFDIAKQKDSAAFYYDKALTYLPDKDNIHYRDIVTSKALLAYNKGGCLDSVIKELKYVVSLSSDEDEKTTRFLTIGNIFFDSKLYDSSRFYLETVFEQKDDISSKIVAAENLCSIYQMKGDSVKVHQYSSFLVGYTVKEMEKKADASKINEMFKDNLSQKQEKEAEAKREASIKNTLDVVIPIAAVLALAIIVTAKMRGKKLLKDKEKRHQQEMEYERQTHKMQQAAMSGRLKRSNEELRELKDQIQQQEDLNATPKQAESFTDEPICRLIMERVKAGQFKSKVGYLEYKDSALSKQQVFALRAAADQHFGQFTVRLKKAYPQLTKTDLDYCCLYLLGLSDADVSALMQKAYPTISQRSRRIRAILGSEASLSTTLRSISNNES